MRRTAVLTVLAASSLAAPRLARADACSPPRVMVVLDKSSSMQTGTINGVTKWEIAKGALDDVMVGLESQAEVGLTTFPNPNACGPGTMDVAPALGNRAAILAALGAAPPSAGNWTPMSQTLEAVATEPALVGADAPRYAVLISDGWQWCSPYDPATRFDGVDAIDALNAAGVRTFIVGFGGATDALALNRMAVEAGTARPGCDPTNDAPADPAQCYYQADDAGELVAALADIANVVTAEICDGLDNDCDGQVDEGLVQACASACGAGVEVCVNGGWQGCDAPAPQPEACNGLDDDCDGTIDPGCDCVAGQTRGCGETSDVGACHPGQQTCDAAGHWGACEGSVGPLNELCNGQDDDCDGLVDEEGGSGDDVGSGLCAADEACLDGACLPLDPVDPPGEDGTDDGGTPAGCGCQAGGGAGVGGGAVLALALALALRRRRQDCPHGNRAETSVAHTGGMSFGPAPEPTADATVEVLVHDRGHDRSVDGILGLIELAGRDQPLEVQLADMCPHVAAIAAADVASVYVRERGPDGDVLVMRGNVGFPAEAVGAVSLRMGEGLTGLVAECMRPVSVASAARDRSYKHVPGIGEERYPAYLGVPLLGGGRVVGVLVVQRRRAEAFTAAEIALATALGAPIVLAIERARQRHADRARGRAARLTGVGVARGAAMGRIAVIPTLVGLPDPRPGAPFDPDLAIERLTVDLERATRHLRGALEPEVQRALDNLGLALVDRRFRDRLADDGRAGAVATLRGVARDYARVPYRVPVRGGAIEPALAERAHEIEDLCVLLYAASTKISLLPPGGVWVGERIGAFVALCAVARGAAALVCDGDVADGPGLAVARAAGIPVLAGVEGLFAWVRPGDLVVVDADAGTLRVNPAASSVESFRRAR